MNTLEQLLDAAEALDRAMQIELYRVSSQADAHNELRRVDLYEYSASRETANRLATLKRIEIERLEPKIVFRELEPRDG